MSLLNLFCKKRIPLTKHQFFNSIDRWINHEIFNLPIESPAKKKVVIYYLSTELTNLGELMRGICKKIDDYDFSSIESDFYKYLRKTEKDCIKGGVPQIFIDRFREWDDSHIDSSVQAIKQISQSKYYASNYLRMSAILDMLSFLVQIQILDVEKTVNSLNGELEKALSLSVFSV